MLSIVITLFLTYSSSQFELLGSEESEYPLSHLKYHQNKDFFQHCYKDESCHRKEESQCWGYEDRCTADKRFWKFPICDTVHHGWAETLKDQEQLFWEQGDFGYIKKKIDTMQSICQPTSNEDSSLICNDNWEHCYAKNLILNFRRKDFSGTERFTKTFFKSGEVGGSCKLQHKLIKKSIRFDGELNSWNTELKMYSNMNNGDCDEVIAKPTVFMKLDAGVNLYHHFCDFFNLYASQHINGSFSTDMFIVMWDTSKLHYGDLFSETWAAFSRYPLKRLSDFAGKKICFHDAMFSLLPRMIYGLYYNTPLVQHCRGGGLFKAFSEHVLHRLGIFQERYSNSEIRLTLLTRSTQYRRILNQDELIGAMKRVKGIKVTTVDYKYRELPFLDQLKISHNSDVFIGIHGAGLTHLLFQPDWGTVFELYNTEDQDCYKDLANLRGVKYFTWEHKEKLFQQDKGHHPSLGEHPKFTNYAFDVDEFMRILTKAIKHVIQERPKL